MVAHVCRYLLAEDVRGVVVLFATTIPHDIVPIFQMPLHGPGGRDACVSCHVSVSCFAQSLRLRFQHSAGYSFVLSLWAYRQVCSVGSALLLIQLQCVHCQQLSRFSIMCHKDNLVPEILAKVFVAGHTEIEAFLLPLLEGSSSQVVQRLNRHLRFLICLYYNLSSHIFILLQLMQLRISYFSPTSTAITGSVLGYLGAVLA